VFIGDTGATCDTTNSRYGFRNIKAATAEDNIVDASGNSIEGSIVGDVSGIICKKNGQELNNVMIKDVVHMPNAGYNLFSLTKRLEEGWSLGGDTNAIWISKGNQKVTFDIKIKTPKGAIFAIYIKRKAATSEEVATFGSDKHKPIKAKVAHSLLGHINEVDSRTSAKYLGYEISKGSMKPCDACAESKSKQKSLPSRTEIVKRVVIKKDTPKLVNERIYLDISTIKAPAGVKVTVKKLQWVIIVEGRTEKKWTDFYESKNGYVEPACVKFQRWKEAGMPVKIIRCDNAGENKLLEKRCNSADWKLNIDFEYTARDTP
jgi:hypothetical protein